MEGMHLEKPIKGNTLGNSLDLKVCKQPSLRLALKEVTGSCKPHQREKITKRRKHKKAMDQGDSTDKEGDEWVKYIEAKLKKNKISRDAGTEISWIPRVPVEFCRNTNEAYKPCIISIGPYHWGNSETKRMEQCKWQCLKDVLDRKRGSHLKDVLDRKSGSHLKECFKVLKPLEVRAKSSYGDDFQLETWGFMEMMLLDCCFIVDYLRQPSRCIPETKTWMKPQIDNDLLLLENQLPFIVLEKMFPLVKKENERERLEDLTLNFCRRVRATGTELTVSMISQAKFQHLLHFYHAYLFFGISKKSSQSTASDPISIRTIHSASFLKNVAGIKFKKQKVRDKVIDARFNPDDGVMNITPLVIDAFSSSQFQNLIAFEKCNPLIEPRFTAFAKFMDYIIDTSTDVRLLRENGIIEHTLGSDEVVAAIFNQLTTGTFDHIPTELAKTYEQADDYYNKQSNKWMAILKQKYINSPWAVISIFVGFLILLFTFTQTFFAIFAYTRPPKS